MSQINPLKKINLQEYQKPKTLIVVHYKGKRISVPLLGDCKNLTQMLYQHIDKFQQTVLRNDPKWEILSRRKIVCFCSNYQTQRQTDNQYQHRAQEHSINRDVQRFLKYSDGDLKIDILLSLIRIENTNFAPTLDITKYYKYMQIQPYFIQHSLTTNSRQQKPSANKYLIHRLLQKTRYKNTYLCRSRDDGHFYSLRVYRSNLAMAQHEALFFNQINQQSIQSNQTIPTIKVFMIPSAEDQDDDLDQNGFKHIAMVYKYCVRGTLRDRLRDKMGKITQNDMLRWIKQLVHLLYQLHHNFNVIHTNLVPQSFQIDQLGSLKLVDFTNWLQCYNQNGQPIQYNINANKQVNSDSSRVFYSPQILSTQSKTSTRFMDHFSIGLIIKQLYMKVYENNNKSDNINKTKLIEKIIQSLISDKQKERQNIVLQIMEGMQKGNQDREFKYHEIFIHLNEIKLGQHINIETSSTCIQNQDHDLQFNAISHQEIINYFKPIKIWKQSTQSQTKIQHNKKVKNKLKVSRGELSNVSNSRQKSVKSIKSNKSSSKQKIRTFSKVSVQKVSKEKSQKKSTQKRKSPMHYLNEINLKNTKTMIISQPGKRVIKRSKQKQQKSEQKTKNSQKQKQRLLKSNKTNNSTTTNNTQKFFNTNSQLSIPMQKKYKSPNK